MANPAEDYRAYRQAKRREEEARLAVFRRQAKVAGDCGVRVVHLSPHQYRVSANGRKADLYPALDRWHPAGDPNPRRGGLLAVLRYLGASIPDNTTDEL